MAMNRKAAVDYAEKHWNQPADDFQIALENGEPLWPNGFIDVRIERGPGKSDAPEKDGWLARFVHDGNATPAEEAAFIQPSPAGASIKGLNGLWVKKTIHGWAGLGDCAHYLSRCLKQGLNAQVPEVWKVDPLVKALQKLAGTKTLVEKVSKAAAQRVIDSGVFQPGDVIAYWDTGDYGRHNEYGHSAMYVGDQWITCHSYARFKDQGAFADKWDLGHSSFTLIHFTFDDPPPSAATVKLLEGWWEVKMGSGPSRFYLFERNGTVRRTNTKPKSKFDPIAHQEDMGYWFEKDLETIYYWQSTGSEERFLTKDPWGDMTDPRGVRVDGTLGTSAQKMWWR